MPSPAKSLPPKHWNAAGSSTSAKPRSLKPPGAPSSIAGQQAAPDSKTIDRKVNQSETPVKHIGKIFFTLGGSNYVCSGNSVTATNKSTVSTAGHCLNEGPGAYATNFVFVPAYLNGAAPYGKWTAKALYAPTQCFQRQHAVRHRVRRHEHPQRPAPRRRRRFLRRPVQRSPRPELQAFGYPAGSPFNGESLKSCSGKATNDPYNPQFNSQGIPPCNMTGGSSGGPWFIGTSSTGYQNSVNSYGYGSNSTTMYGPYWGGTVIQSTYNTAAAAS